MPNKEHAWTINFGDGIAAAGGWRFEASMVYRIVLPADSEQWKCKTIAYRYHLSKGDEDIWRLHWHPNGVSPVTYPHLHGRFTGTADDEEMLKKHLPMGRATLEDAIRWAQQTGFPTVRADWNQVLEMCEAEHLIHRTWGGQGNPAV